MKRVDKVLRQLLFTFYLISITPMAFAQSTNEYWCQIQNDLHNIAKYCVKDDLVMLSGIYVTKYCDFSKPVVPVGNSRVACYYLGYERTKRATIK